MRPAPPFYVLRSADPSISAHVDKMAEEKPSTISFDFSNTTAIDSILSWLNPPASVTLVEGTGLKVVPGIGTDFWRKTYRDPSADRNSGHALLFSIPPGKEKCLATTEFSILGDHLQYDQAGVMVYVDNRHWVKAGIEIENGVPNMSCVVTDGESDWNYTLWSASRDVQIRVTVELFPGVCECKVEYRDEQGGWSLLREAPIGIPSGGEGEGVRVGIMCCSPKKESEDKGMEAVFKSLTIE